MDVFGMLGSLEKLSWHGLEIMDFGFALNLALRFLINIGVTLAILKKIYYNTKHRLASGHERGEFFYVFLVFNILVFFVSSLLADTKVKMGFAFGLFAIFSILRYRTVQIGIREMTFLFVSIITAVINSTVTAKIGLVEIACVDGIILGTIFFLEKQWMRYYLPCVRVRYERIELVSQGDRSRLIADIQQRTGLQVRSIDIKSVDLLRDCAKIDVYYEALPHKV